MLPASCARSAAAQQLWYQVLQDSCQSCQRKSRKASVKFIFLYPCCLAQGPAEIPDVIFGAAATSNEYGGAAVQPGMRALLCHPVCRAISGVRGAHERAAASCKHTTNHRFANNSRHCCQNPSPLPVQAVTDVSDPKSRAGSDPKPGAALLTPSRGVAMTTLRQCVPAAGSCFVVVLAMFSRPASCMASFCSKLLQKSVKGLTH